MADYRRFIAYFYEYIDGRKQKNAGFAKVELRGGLWRILFRISEGISLELPIQIYGFVRTGGYLLKLPMGTMHTGQERMQEWAYRADVPAAGAYKVEELAGILLVSADEREFLTVWDEERIETEKFVSELPGEVLAEEPTERQITEGSAEEPTKRQIVERSAEEPTERQIVERSAEEPTKRQIVERSAEEPTERQIAERLAEEPTERHMAEILAEQQIQQAISETPDGDIQRLLRTRTRFTPFDDMEIGSCVMLRPCDVSWLQQRGWQVGRSSFLQHGFYQYRHLLLGVSENGSYIIGVPGINNPQEKYMAGMFGFDTFKPAPGQGNNCSYGYWYRPLERRM